MSGWVTQVVSFELRKVFTYRFTFWVKYFVGAITELTVAYFLWGAIFAATAVAPGSAAGEVRLGGYTFHGLLYYTLFATLGANVVRTLDRGGEISGEIYQGTLSRYLVYPVPYLAYRYASYFGLQLISVGQLLFGVAVALAIFGVPADLAITPSSIALGIFTALLSGALSFSLTACLELIAFWQDTVWNLMAMLRFIGNLLGGLMIPLSLFPEWGREVVAFTPFPYLFSFPIRCFLGQIGPAEWFREAGVLGFWILATSGAAAFIWRRGTRVYSGVGI